MTIYGKSNVIKDFKKFCVSDGFKKNYLKMIFLKIYFVTISILKQHALMQS